MAESVSEPRPARSPTPAASPGRAMVTPHPPASLCACQGTAGMTQEQADAGSVRERRSRGRRIRAVCRHREPGPACSSFSSCCRTDRWISVGILGRSVHSPLPQASQPQLTSWALSPGPSLGTQRYQPWGGLMDTGLGRVLWGLAGLPRTWGGWAVEWEEGGAILRVCPPHSPPPLPTEVLPDHQRLPIRLQVLLQQLQRGSSGHLVPRG